MKVLDLFAGLKGWSDPWAERGHEVFTVDYDCKFDVDLHTDVLYLTPDDLPWRPDVVLASPPCEAFSVLRVSDHWDGGYGIPDSPISERAREAVALVAYTLQLIEQLDPLFWVLENPVGKLRKLRMMRPYRRVTVTYCKYGRDYQKPTDLWGGFPVSWKPIPECGRHSKYRRVNCHHRSGRDGLMGVDSAEERAKIPEALSESICIAAESDLRHHVSRAERLYDEALAMDELESCEEDE